MGQYERIAGTYTDKWRMEHPERKHLIYPSWLKDCGNIYNKKILDLGCGGGDSSRLLASRGAIVTGLDNEVAMLRIAWQKEQKNKLGIRYFSGNAAWPALMFLFSIGGGEKFDLVTPTFLLHYAKSKAQLKRMRRNIYLALKPGGRMVAINHYITKSKYLFHPMKENRSFTIEFVEGSKVQVTYYWDREAIDYFMAYFWQPETYEACLKSAGFSSIKWHPVKIDEEGKKLCPNWQELEKMPIAILSAEKP